MLTYPAAKKYLMARIRAACADFWPGAWVGEWGDVQPVGDVDAVIIAYIGDFEYTTTNAHGNSETTYWRLTLSSKARTRSGLVNLILPVLDALQDSGIYRNSPVRDISENEYRAFSLDLRLHSAELQ